MNIKDYLLPLGLALLSTWAIQYFFFGSKDQQTHQDRSGQSFVAPTSSVAYTPLVHEIDFVDEKRVAKSDVSTVETPLATYVFSTDGACLYRFDAKRVINGTTQTITTIFPQADSEREARCFLLALPEKSPYFYKLAERHDEAGLTRLTYVYSSDVVDLTKKFTVFTDSYRIDLEITVEPKKGMEGAPLRIVFPSPILVDASVNGSLSDVQLANSDTKALIAGPTGSVQKIPASKITTQSGWFSPVIFGADNKYFVNAMIEDQQHFVERGYFALNVDKLVAYLETKAVSAKTTWNLSFYVGPKEDEALMAVNKRLEDALEYSGWLAPISRLALALLKWLYAYLQNYGLAIIALTVLLKLVLLPFTWGAEQGMKKTQELKKKLHYIEQKYKDNPALLKQYKTEIIQKHGMPGISGCLPLLVQIPVFFALNRVLSSSIELYRAPFFGWITDLSASDPYYTLPLLIVIAMLLQAVSTDPQQRFAVIVMALVFGAIATNLSAGLCLYIVTSTLLAIGQTFIQRQFKAA